MSLLDKFSKLITPWTHGHPPNPARIPPASPPSDATSDQIHRTETSDERNAPILLSVEAETGSSLSARPAHLSSVGIHNYAEASQPRHQHRSVRSSTSTDQSVTVRRSVMNRSLPSEISMSSKERHRAASRDDDERRLFPNYAAPSDSTAIVPGQASVQRKKLRNITPYKPVDMLSRNARDSGPIRAKGKEKPTRRINNRASPRSSFSYSGENGTLPEWERPMKRQRRDSSDLALNRTITVSDDDVSHTAPDLASVTGNSVRRSSLSSQLSAAKSRKLRETATRHDEFRAVESSVKPPRSAQCTPRSSTKFNNRSPDSDKDELLMENTARTGRLPASYRNVSPNPGQRIISSVEFPSNRDGGPTRTASSRSFSKEHMTSKPTRIWSPDVVESSDELQGDSTVPPAPAFLSKARTKISTAKAPCGKQDKTSNDGASESPEIQSTVPQKKKIIRRPKCKKIFKARFFRTGTISFQPPNGETMDLVVRENSIKLAGEEIDPESAPLISFKKITRVSKGDGLSRKISIEMSKSGTNDNRTDIELLSPTVKDDLCKLFETMDLKVQTRASNWMDSAFQRKGKHLLPQANGTKRPSEDHTEEVFEQNPVTSKRTKLSDSLRDFSECEHEPNKSTSSPVFNTRADPLHHAAKPSGSSGSEAHQPSSPKTEQKGVEIPVKNYNPNTPSSERATRSMSRREQPATVVCDDEDDDYIPTPKPIGKSNKWYKPLVYPRFGKKKAEVDAQDCDRLREHEFLNDNLIGFYIRFLEDHLNRRNQEVAKRVYFFNSYFFATLTNGPRGKRIINYEGVEKWTRSVDIFSYDYIVVPINENAHWYVAIICNLPRLQHVSQGNEAEDERAEEDNRTFYRRGDDTNEVPETPESSEQLPSERTGIDEDEIVSKKEPETTRQRLASMSLSDTELPRHGDTEWPVQEENPSSSPAKFQSPSNAKSNLGSKKDSGLKKSPRRPLKPKRKGPVKKHDINQPIIITFDSLNLARSPTITTLRDYLYAESKSKRDIEIDKSLIKGMKAREIPLQSNYSDCGLYLLAYIEKFVQDPDDFIKKLLRKEMDSEGDWPPLRSGLLRARLRGFLDNLYDEQLQLEPQNPQERDLMVDQNPICYLLGPSETDRGYVPNAGAGSAFERDTSPTPRGQLPPGSKKHESPILEGTPGPSAKPELALDDPISVEHGRHSPPIKGFNRSPKMETTRSLPVAFDKLEESSLSNSQVEREAGEKPEQTGKVVEVSDSQQQRIQLSPPPPSPPKVVIDHESPTKSPKSHKKIYRTTKQSDDGEIYSSEHNPEQVLRNGTAQNPKSTSVEVQIVEPRSSVVPVVSNNPRSGHKKRFKPSKHRA